MLLGDEVHEVEAGGYVLKPRGAPHAFWNPGPESARFVEIFSPAGFEHYFEELAQILSAGGPPDVAAIGELAAHYGLTFHWERVEEISRRYGVSLG